MSLLLHIVALSCALITSPVTLTAAFMPASQSRCHSSITSHPSHDTPDDSLQNHNTTIIADHTFRTPTSAHLQTIQERQVFHGLEPEQVFCTSSNLCKHGHPQAFGFHPTKGRKLVSGLFRLSCPLLCEAIDEYENEGGVRQSTDWLRSKDIMDDSSKDWKKEGYEQANLAQKQIRTELAKDDQDTLISRMGEFNANAFMESGVAGIPSSQTYNVKCIHAHVADHLCRCPSSTSSDGDDTSGSNTQNNNSEGVPEKGNIIGQHALQILEKRGVPISGNDACWQQCNVNHQRGPDDWSYLAKKNRSGLRRRGSNSITRRFQLSDDEE